MVTANVFVVAPAATVTEPSTVAALLLLLSSVTTAPPAGAALVSVTVPVLPALPVTAVGLTLTPTRAAGPRIHRQRRGLDHAAVCGRDGHGRRDRPPLVVTANVFVVAPAATVTEPSTVAALALLLLSVTTAPPAGAALVSVTVPVLPALPVTAVGLTLTPTRAAGPAGFTVSVAVLTTPLYVAVMVTAVGTVPPLVVTANVSLSPLQPR